MRYTIYIDGGSRGNGTDSQEAYGSSKTFAGASDGKQRHYHFGNFTNNEAEYLVLLRTLQNLYVAEGTGFLKADDVVIIKSDSALVVNQVNGDWKVKDDEMKLLCSRSREFLRILSNAGVIVSIQKVPRFEILSVLGH